MTETEKKSENAERHSYTTTANPEAVNKEANADMPSLVEGRKKLIQFLKDGGRSGISLDFGKPTLVDSGPERAATPEAAGKAPPHWGEQPALTYADGVTCVRTTDKSGGYI